MQIWCDGQWMLVEDFPSSPTDRGFTHGLGLFETMLVLDGRPIFLMRHLARLKTSCERLGWDVDFGDFKAIAVQLLEVNHLTQIPARLRITITAGSGPLNNIGRGADARLWLTAQALTESSKPLTAMICPWPRNEHSPLAGLKCASYAENLIALDHARHLGFEESIFLNTAGHLCESATANLFLVTNGTLLTPLLASGCLPGIAREVVMELATQERIAHQELQLTLQDLESADEIFLTSSLQGIRRVVQVGTRNYLATTVTSRIDDAWKKLISP